MHCLKKLENFLCRVIVFLIAVYRVIISPFFPRCCRFDPTCSVYAQEAFLRHGFIKGLYLSCWRILRCNPWNPGGKDPVP